MAERRRPHRSLCRRPACHRFLGSWFPYIDFTQRGVEKRAGERASEEEKERERGQGVGRRQGAAAGEGETADEWGE